ncbi:hypothetical protein M1D93_01175 [Arthrobacter sp. Z1-9]
MEVNEIVEDDEASVLHLPLPSGQVPREWLDTPRSNFSRTYRHVLRVAD